MSSGNYSQNENTSPNFGSSGFSEFKNRTNALLIHEGSIFESAEKSYFGVFIYPLCIVSAYIVLGLLGNITVLYIFGIKWRRNKTSVFIITLASLDVVNCSINMPFEVFVLSKPLSFDYDIFCKCARCLSYITTASYSFVLVAVAFDRYLMVCRPLKRMTLGKRYATRTCFAAVFAGVITQFPSVFIYGTFVFHIPIPSANSTVQQVFVEGKTCLVTNYYYYEEPTLTYAFQGFLFAGHVVIFIALAVMYIIIGRRLFIASKTDLEMVNTNPKLLRKSIISAITGSVLCGTKTKSLSTDYIPRTRYSKTPRSSTQSELETQCKTFSDDEVSKECYKPGKSLASTKNATSKSLGNIYLHSLSVLPSQDIDIKRSNANGRDNGVQKDNSYSKDDTSFTGLANDGFKFGDVSQTKGRMEVRPQILGPRSMSLDGSQLYAVCVEKPRSQDLKELSLKRNTLIMRMVTFTFMLSYLPFLIIVTLRYSNPEIPGKLQRTSQIVYHIFLRSYFFNSITRPVIYTIMNEDFRWSVIKLLKHINICKN